MASLRAEHIIKKFGKQTALNDVSFEIEDGEFVCVLGPSGCGKSTLLRVIAGLEDIESGKVEIGGRDVTGEPPSARNFGIVFQSYALFPNMTAEENVAYGLWNKRLSREEIASRVSGALEMVGLAEQRKKYPQQLSGGQQQRVAIARAIVLKPEFLLLDEPLSALDAKVRVKLRRELRHIQQKLGITTIMVTHDQEEALSLADRVIVMNNSVIEQIDTPQKVYESPSSPFVADFVGTVNFVGGRKRRGPPRKHSAARRAFGGFHPRTRLRHRVPRLLLPRRRGNRRRRVHRGRSRAAARGYAAAFRRARLSRHSR